MSASLCTRCLGRLRIQASQAAPSVITSQTQLASFHTTSSRSAPGAHRVKIIYRNLNPKIALKKKKVEPKQRRAIGELRQQRSRIVVSNTNAPAVQGLGALTLRNGSDDGMLGHVLSFDDTTIDRLRASRGFKRTQSWRLFRTPATLWRKETIEIGKMILEDRDEAQTNRIVVTGERISGKSVLLAQAMAMASMRGWIVITVPEAQEFVMDQFAYSPVKTDAQQDEPVYNQSTLAAAILGRMAASNDKILSSLKPNSSPPEQLKIPEADARTLLQIAKYGSETPRQGSEILTYILSELTQPGQQSRPPVLLAVDGLNHWMTLTDYKTPEMARIHAHQFVIIRNFLEHLFTANHPLSYGGLVIGASTGSNTKAVPAFELLTRQCAALRNGTKPDDPSFPLPGAFQYLDPRPLSLLDPNANTQVMDLQGLSKQETGFLLEYFVLSGILKEHITKENVAEKWALSGNGIVGQLCALGTRARIDPEKIVTTKIGTYEGIRVGQGEHRPRKLA